MQRTTITLDDELAAELDAYLRHARAPNRSEAVRDLIRQGLAARRTGFPDTPSIAVISYALDQTTRDLAARMPQERLDRHDQTVASLSVPLDHSTSIDITVMRTKAATAAAFAQTLFLERGVMHGHVHLIPVAEETDSHAHADGGTREHTHLRVRSSF